MPSRARKLLRRTVRRVLGRRAPLAMTADNLAGPGLTSPGTLLRLDGRIPVLTRPTTVPAAFLGLRPEELVLGVVVDDRARLYPTRTLQHHHIVNDHLAGRDLAVTFCRRCFSGIVFDARIDGAALEFDVYGIHRGTMCMRDTATATVWDRVTGRALAGPMAGRELEPVPAWMGEAEAWLTEHPDSDAPAVSGNLPPAIRPGDVPLVRRFWSTVPRWDDRLPARAMVLGVTIEGHARAYPFDPARRGPVVAEDVLGHVPIVLLAPAGGWPVAFERRVDGEILRLQSRGARAVDEESCPWSLEGRCTGGRHDGRRLAPVRSFAIEWYAWAAAFEHTEVAEFPLVGPPDPVPTL